VRHLKLHPASDKNSINNGSTVFTRPKCIPKKMDFFGIMSVCVFQQYCVLARNGHIAPWQMPPSPILIPDVVSRPRHLICSNRR
jgi:hypothetical protein